MIFVPTDLRIMNRYIKHKFYFLDLIKRMLFIWYGILIVQYLISINAKWVVDVDSSIINEINQNPSIGYLIQFHAPWFVFLTKFSITLDDKFSLLIILI